MRNLLFRIWKWLKERFQGRYEETATLTRKERRSLRRYKEKYSGRRIFTKAPAIHLSYDWPFKTI